MKDPRPRYVQEIIAWKEMRCAEMIERLNRRYDTTTGTERERLQTERNAELRAFWEDSCTLCCVTWHYAWDRSGKYIKVD
jgi:hypothetical protein